MNIAQRIQQRMDEIGMTQDQLATRIGLTQPAVFKLLSGRTRRTTRLIEIAWALGVRPEWLSDGIEPKEPFLGKEDQAFISEYLVLPPEEKEALRVLVRRRQPPRSPPSSSEPFRAA